MKTNTANTTETCNRCNKDFEETDVSNEYEGELYHDMCVFFEKKEDEEKDKNTERRHKFQNRKQF